MDERGEQWVPVASAASEQRAAELALVLTARGIEHERRIRFGAVELWVPAQSAASATAELAAYRSESGRAIGPRALEEISPGGPGVIAYVVVLVVAFYCVHLEPLGLDWYGAGRLDAGRVVAGDWWRVVTALTLHLALDHLGGNLVFGAFFGWFVGRYLGTGVGWLTVLGAAALANTVNAWVQPAEHRAIGASTAVFAALGLLSAYTWRRGYLAETPWRARIAPIVAGLGLLAFTGTAGENTDLLAHLFGFVMGIGGGVLLAATVPVARLRSRRVQRACAALAVAVLAAAWIAGLAAAG